MTRPPLRLVSGALRPGEPRPVPAELIERAIPLARQLALMADVIGPASRDVADELIALLESPRRPRRIA